MAVRTRTGDTASPATTPSEMSVRPWLIGLALLIVVVPTLSSAIGLYDRIRHWGKLVHGLEGFLVACLVGWLVLGWRDRERIDLTDQLGALLTVFCAVFFNVMWEIVEFVLDWVTAGDLQKSNSDTMTDLLWGDLAAVLGTGLAARLYFHVLGPAQRDELGGRAAWLLSGPSRLLARHGLLIGLVVAVAAAAAVAALWIAGRPVPGLPTG